MQNACSHRHILIPLTDFMSSSERHVFAQVLFGCYCYCYFALFLVSSVRADLFSICSTKRTHTFSVFTAALKCVFIYAPTVA